jgi:hypothetical protein
MQIYAYIYICIYIYITCRTSSPSSKDELLDLEGVEARVPGYPKASSIVAAAVAASTPV